MLLSWGTLVMLLLGTVGMAHAQAPATRPGASAMAFQNGINGLALGGFMGLSTGYLFARDDGWQSGDWRTLGIGAGVGALVGAGVGITLGAVDAGRDDEPFAGLLLKTATAGATFGTALGLVAGAVSWLSSNEAEHILFGGAIGTLAGAAVGAGLAVIEYNNRPGAPAASAGQRLALTLGATGTVRGEILPMPILAGTY